MKTAIKAFFTEIGFVRASELDPIQLLATIVFPLQSFKKVHYSIIKRALRSLLEVDYVIDKEDISSSFFMTCRMKLNQMYYSQIHKIQNSHCGNTEITVKADVIDNDSDNGYSN